MDMKNHGTVWHIDHVLPVSLFDIEKIEEQDLILPWFNLMPYPAKENIVKGNKILPEQLRFHIKKIKKYCRLKEINLPIKYLKRVRDILQCSGTP